MRLAFLLIFACFITFINYGLYQFNESEAISKGSRIHQNLIEKLLRDPNEFFYAIEDLPVEVRMII